MFKHRPILIRWGRRLRLITLLRNQFTEFSIILVSIAPIPAAISYFLPSGCLRLIFFSFEIFQGKHLLLEISLLGAQRGWQSLEQACGTGSWAQKTRHGVKPSPVSPRTLILPLISHTPGPWPPSLAVHFPAATWALSVPTDEQPTKGNLRKQLRCCLHCAPTPQRSAELEAPPKGCSTAVTFPCRQVAGCCDGEQASEREGPLWQAVPWDRGTYREVLLGPVVLVQVDASPVIFLHRIA